MPALDSEATIASPALTYARLLRESHALIVQGRGDSPEAEALAEQMDEPWYALSAREQQRMRGLSADLHALLEGGPKRVEMTPDQIALWQKDARSAWAAAELGDVDVALPFLRQPVPSNLPPGIIPFLQARCWEKLGDFETALMFMQEAERVDPEQAVTVLILLQRLGKVEEAKEYAGRIAERSGAPALELYLAASALLSATRNLSDREATPELRRIIGVLERAGALVVSSGEQEIPDLDAWIAFALGLCYERLGDTSAAVKTYSAALARHPRHGELFVARGLARYPQATPEALRDFLNATRYGATSVWPWYILARHALREGAYGEALRLALQAAERPSPEAVAAEVYETIAIAQAMLGQPRDRVLDNFEKAVQLDPANQRLRRNLEITRGQKVPVQGSRDWRRDLKVEPIEPSKVRQGRTQEITSGLGTIAEEHETRMSEYLLTSAA